MLQLTDVVRHFVERDQKVLVIGRKHMYSFSKDFLAYVRENSTLFFIDDSYVFYSIFSAIAEVFYHIDTFYRSEDDPYMIYATFYSGPNACFVTRDLMRSEKFRLSSHELAVLFKRWQHSHQIFINHISFGSGRLYLKVSYHRLGRELKFGSLFMWLFSVSYYVRNVATAVEAWLARTVPSRYLSG